jgi:hypothetical protein
MWRNPLLSRLLSADRLWVGDRGVCRILAGVTLVCLAVFFCSLGSVVPRAAAAQLIDRDATDVTLAVNAKGEALVTYRADGVARHVLVWGAINARAPSRSTPQVHFDFDYTGGWGKYRDGSYWEHFGDICGPYNGPTLPYVVAACTAPDGSYWALQSWSASLPDLGFVPWTRALAASSLEVSHWRGPAARVRVFASWVPGDHNQRIFGQVTYLGRPVYGYSSTRDGAPLDDYGRLVYVDTLDSPAYGPGWRRDNSFLTHSPSGTWCYGFYSRNPLTGGYIAPPGYSGLRGPGIGTMYRVTVNGPGVTPVVSATITNPGSFDAADPSEVSFEKAMETQLLALGPDALCDLRSSST